MCDISELFKLTITVMLTALSRYLIRASYSLQKSDQKETVFSQPSEAIPKRDLACFQLFDFVLFRGTDGVALGNSWRRVLEYSWTFVLLGVALVQRTSFQ